MCFRKKQVLSKRYQNLLAPHLILHSMMLELRVCQAHFAFTNLLPVRLYQSGSTKENKKCGGKKHWIYLLCSYSFQFHLNKVPTQNHIISVGAELNVQSIVLVISGTSRTLHVRSPHKAKQQTLVNSLSLCLELLVLPLRVASSETLMLWHEQI